MKTAPIMKTTSKMKMTSKMKETPKIETQKNLWPRGVFLKNTWILFFLEGLELSHDFAWTNDAWFSM